MEDWLSKQVKENLIPVISDFIKIPNQSRNFDSEWETNGFQQQACEFCMNWAEKQGVKGMTQEYIKEEGKPPVVLAIIEPFAGSKETVTPELEKTIFMYGHIDKQPPLEDKWSEGLGPWKPVIKNNRLYGRGGVDDGYAFFTSVMIVRALQEFNYPHNRIVLFYETDEESGSRDLVYFLNKLKSKIGEPSVVYCLDSGCVDYDHMCLTSTLRGFVMFNLRVDVVTQAQHSGDSSGVVPGSFRILRNILDQFEDSQTGKVISDFYVDIPAEKYLQAEELLKSFGGSIDFKFPKVEGCEDMGNSGLQNYLNRIWRPMLTITGIEGIPSLEKAGNVLRPYTTVKCSLRLPPSLNETQTKEALKNFFDNVKVPHNAKVSYEFLNYGSGFECPTYQKNFLEIIKKSGQESFNKPVLFYGEGGSIPFLNDLKVMFPKAQFIVTGLIGPEANAHGPDEMLELGAYHNLTIALAKIMRDSPGNI